MNEHQKRLYDLLKEIDAFCRKHNITYYCAGGTVIGAARHRGFIPWDDDIDIYMKRDEFRRFTEAFAEDGPADRKLEYYEADHGHRSMVNRYHKEGSTMFGHYHLVSTCSAGILIDVFVLDPFPNGYEAQREYLSKFFVYSDLVSPVLVYGQRVPLEHYHYYDKYMAKARENGVPQTVKELEEELFIHKEEDCDNFCLRWGSVPLIYPKDVLGEPVYLPFEDIEIPVPQNWYKYLVVHYGCDWVEIPYVEEHKAHNNIVRTDLSYEYFYDKRDKMFSMDYLEKIHQNKKDAVRKSYGYAISIGEEIAEFHNSIFRTNVMKRLGATGKTFEELFDQCEYNELIEVLEPYIRMQTSRAYMGAMMMHGPHFRWLNPVIAPISEDVLRMLLFSLLHVNKVRVAEKLCGIYIRRNVQRECVDEVQEIIDNINLAARLYYTGEYAECLDFISKTDPDMEYPELEDYYWLSRAQLGIGEDAGVLQQKAEAENSSERIRKAWGDCLWNNGRRDEATEVYTALMAKSRNGMFWLDISGKGVSIDEIPTKRAISFVHNDRTRLEQKLLSEIADICDRNGIRYVLNADLSRRMFLCGDIGYSDKNRIVYMDALNAQKFMDVFEREKPEHRKILSWDNSSSVRDFALVYTDTESIICNFRRLGEWKEVGINITIRILRDKGNPKKWRDRTALREAVLGFMTMEPLDRCYLVNRKKKMAHGVLHKSSKKQKERFRKRLFRISMGREKSENAKGFYYYRNVRGMRTELNNVPAREWERVARIEIDGTSYCIPASVTESQLREGTRIDNQIRNTDIFNCWDTEVSWEDILPQIDEKKYYSLDWENYGIAAKNARFHTRKADRAWMFMLRLDDELNLNSEYAGKVPEVEAALNAGRIAEAGEMLAELDDTLREYKEYDVPVYLGEPIRKVYSRYLVETGQKAFKNKLDKLWDTPEESFRDNM